jgi:hypothetical protein
MDPEVIGGEPAPEPTITDVAEEPTDLEALADEANNPEPQEPEPVEEDDSEEFEWEGKQVKGPKGLKDGVLRQADYTRKTQATAQRERELDVREASIVQRTRASEEELTARAQLFHVDSELARFKDYDWPTYQAHRQQDILAADEAWNYKAHLSAQKQEIGKQISAAETARSAEAQQDTAKRMHETEQYARSKGWTAETDKQVIDFALSKGATKEALGQMMSPLVYEMIHLARLGQQLLDKPATPKPVPQTQPLKVVAAKANPPARVNLYDPKTSMDDYAAARQKQIEARR